MRLIGHLEVFSFILFRDLSPAERANFTLPPLKSAKTTLLLDSDYLDNFRFYLFLGQSDFSTEQIEFFAF